MKEPKYYDKNGLSPLKAFEKGLLSEEEYIGFVKGNIIKYTVRVGHKEDNIKDCEKAIHYLTILKEYYVKKQEAENTGFTLNVSSSSNFDDDKWEEIVKEWKNLPL